MSQEEASAELNVLIREFGKEDADAVQILAPLLFDMYQEKARQASKLRYWYVTRHLVDHLRKTKYTDSVSTTQGPVQYRLRERIESLENMRADAQSEIDKLEKQARASRPGASGQMTAAAPREVTCGPDPNAPQYRGDPLTRSYSPR